MARNDELYFANEAQAKRYATLNVIKLALIYFFLVLGALFTLLPFYWMIATSLKDAVEITTTSNFFPANPWENGLANYTEVFMKTGSASDGYVTLLDCVKNTILVGTLTTIGTVCTTVLSAFAFSRLEFKGRELLFSILLATMMIPGEMMIITNFETVATLDWLDTYQALIIPFCASVFYTFFLRQTFLQIPNELYYAAKVDGKSDFGYLFKVMIPIARPTIISITILSMIGSWNAYIWPRTVSANKKLVTDGIMSLFQSMEGGESSHIVMAAATVVAIPLLIAFICFKKYIMRGVGRSGIKG